ncbi:hypothetical protein Tco_1446117, partial [Tanacetum coccineum]
MEANDDGQDSAKKKLNFKVKHIDSDSGPSKKIGKTKISKKRKLLGTTSTDEEAAAKAKAEEKTTKKEIKEAKREARKKVAKKKQPEEDTKENVSDNEEYDYQSDDAADKEKADEEIKKGKAALIVELKAIEKRAENKLNEDNDVNVNENADETDNEDNADQNDDVDEVLTNIETLPFLNTPKISKKKDDGKDITKTVDETKDNRKRKFKRSGSEEPEKKKTNRQK